MPGCLAISTHTPVSGVRKALAATMTGDRTEIPDAEHPDCNRG